MINIPCEFNVGDTAYTEQTGPTEIIAIKGNFLIGKETGQGRIAMALQTGDKEGPVWVDEQKLSSCP